MINHSLVIVFGLLMTGTFFSQPQPLFLFFCHLPPGGPKSQRDSFLLSCPCSENSSVGFPLLRNPFLLGLCFTSLKPFFKLEAVIFALLAVYLLPFFFPPRVKMNCFGINHSLSLLESLHPLKTQSRSSFFFLRDHPEDETIEAAWLNVTDMTLYRDEILISGIVSFPHEIPFSGPFPLCGLPCGCDDLAPSFP